MRADDRALLDDDDGKVRVELLQPNGGRKARGARADDHDVVIHRFALGQFGVFGQSRHPSLRSKKRAKRDSSKARLVCAPHPYATRSSEAE